MTHYLELLHKVNGKRMYYAGPHIMGASLTNDPAEAREFDSLDLAENHRLHITTGRWLAVVSKGATGILPAQDEISSGQSQPV